MEGRETLGVILICRQSRRQCCNNALSGSLLVLEDWRTPVVLASVGLNKKAEVFTVISNVHVFPFRNVNCKPISHSQNVLFGA